MKSLGKIEKINIIALLFFLIANALLVCYGLFIEFKLDIYVLIDYLRINFTFCSLLCLNIALFHFFKINKYVKILLTIIALMPVGYYIIGMTALFLMF